MALVSAFDANGTSACTRNSYAPDAACAIANRSFMPTILHWLADELGVGLLGLGAAPPSSAAPGAAAPSLAPSVAVQLTPTSCDDSSGNGCGGGRRAFPGAPWRLGCAWPFTPSIILVAVLIAAVCCGGSGFAWRRWRKRQNQERGTAHPSSGAEIQFVKATPNRPARALCADNPRSKVK
jgi:hypothetical protein